MPKDSNKGLVGAAVFASVIISASLTFFATQMMADNQMSDNDFDEKVFAAIDLYVEELESGERSAGDAARKAVYDRNEAADDDAFLGDDDAPVLIVEFSDYQCPYCKKFYSDTLPQLKENYIDSGKVQFVYRDFTLTSHPGALPAANFAECVREQTNDETYYAVHDQIFDTLGRNFDYDSMEEFVGQFGVDNGELKECYSDNKYKAEIIADRDYAVKFGISGTPGFLVNGKKLSGAQPYEAFERAIEAELANS
jgi:protein-disulfide isomerase